MVDFFRASFRGVSRRAFGTSERGTVGRYITHFIGYQPATLLLSVHAGRASCVGRAYPPRISIFCGCGSVSLRGCRLLVAIDPACCRGSPVPYLSFFPGILRLNVKYGGKLASVGSILASLCVYSVFCEFGLGDVTSISSVSLGGRRPVLGRLTSACLHDPFGACPTRMLSGVPMPRPSSAMGGTAKSKDITRTTTVLDTRKNPLLIKGRGKRAGSFACTVTVDGSTVRSRRSDRRGKGRKRKRVRVIKTKPNSPRLVSVQNQQVLRGTSLVLCTKDLIPGRLALYTGGKSAVHDSTSVGLRRRFTLVGGFCSGKGFVMHLRANSPYVCKTVRRRVTFFSHCNVDCRVAPKVSSFRTTTTTLHSRFAVPRGIRAVVLAHNRKHAPVPRGRRLRGLTTDRDAVYVFLDTNVTKRIRGRLLRRCPPAAPMTTYCGLA